VRLRNWVAAGAACTALVPAAAAQAAPAPLTANYTATDVSATDHQWYVTGTTTTTAGIAQGGTVTFGYPTGTSRHDVFFGTKPPTTCTPAASATGAVPPAGPTRSPWTASCRFDTPGTYSFLCQLHPTMIGTVVVSPADAADPVGGSVPDVLSLGVGESANLGRFLLGVAADYTATLPAVVTSTMANATLTVADPSPTAPGHLLNGMFVMAQPLQVTAGTTFALLTGPVALLSWPGPVSSNNVTVTFKQPIAATDPLRSGAYAKTLVFTLSTTGP
jgi:plastocyanin